MILIKTIFAREQPTQINQLSHICHGTVNHVLVESYDISPMKFYWLHEKFPQRYVWTLRNIKDAKTFM